MHRLVAECVTESLEQGRLAVRACAMIDKQYLFARRTGHAVADGSLEERARARVREQSLKRRLPARRHRVLVVSDWRQLADSIVSPMLAKLACPQIDRAVRSTEEPRICVELVDLDRDAFLRARQRDHCIDRVFAFGALRVICQFLPLLERRR